MATSYTDPIYQDLTSKVEAQLGLPSGLLSDIVTKGERSNADQVSEKGAKTVFQVIPKTRDAMLEKYGVDAYVSPENAALAAGYVLRDGVNFAKKQADDPTQIRRLAAGYYHAGGNAENWGPRTQAYMDRVQPVESTYARAKRERGAGQDPITAQVKAYSSGKMSPEEKAAFEQSIARGEVVVPANMMPKTPAASGVTVGAKTLQAYRSGSMRPEDRAEFESLVKSGELVLPNGVSLEAARGEIPSAPTPEQIAAGATMPTAPAATRATAPNATLGDKALAVGETGLAMVGGLGSLLAGAAGGIQGAIEAPFVGDAMQPIRRAQEAAGYVQSLTAPRTAAGQEMLQSVAESPLMQNLQALGPMGMVPTAGTRAVAQSAQTARQMAPAIAQEVTQAVKPAVAQVVQALPKRNPAIAAEKAAQTAQAGELVQAGERVGVPVMTSDVQAPQTFIGKSLRDWGEKIPFTGTAGKRVEQQAARETAVRSFLEDVGVSDQNAIEAVTADVLKKRSDDLKKYTGFKSEIVDQVDKAGAVDVSRASAAIDKEISSLQSLNNDKYAPLIAELGEFKKSLQGQSLTNVEQLRKDFGTTLSSKPGLVEARGTAEKAAGKIYTALKEDIASTVEAVGGKPARMKWEVSNARLSEMIGEGKNTSLRRVLSTGEATPEAAASLLLSNKRSDNIRLYSNLTPEGKKNASIALMQEVIKKSGGIEELSPTRFANELAKRSEAVGVFLNAEQKARANDLVRVLQATKRAAEAGFMPNTGAALTPFFLFDIAGTGGMSTLATLSLGSLSRAYESKAFRNLAYGLRKTEPGSRKELELVKKITSSVGGAQAAQTRPAK